jgi:hypothetical protein
MASAHQNIQSLGANGMYGTNTVYGGGGQAVARSELDYLRIGIGQEPSAQYPDGYLGTIRSRRDDRGRPASASDKMLDSLKTRTGQRSYQRGVHKGERVDPGDYYYPSRLEPDRGIKRQMKSVRQGNVMMSKKNTQDVRLTPAPHLVNDGKANMRSTSPGEINQRRVDQFARMRPGWK